MTAQERMVKAIAERKEPGRTVALLPCAGCRRPVIVGMVDPAWTWAVTCDPEPLTAYGEAIALLAGRTTYRVTELSNGKRQLNGPRNQFDIPVVKAGDPGVDIVVLHRCHQVGAFQQTGSTIRWPDTMRNTVDNDEPGF